MDMGKAEILKTFNQNPKRYWHVKLFDELGFKRQQCKKCGKHFWSLTEQDFCNDSSCRPYEFIEKPVTKKRFDYLEALEAIRNFFIANEHYPLPPYPVVCRWFPGLYFTIASIVDFQRAGKHGTVFEFPVNPVIIFQPCLRFNDIPNVGVTGRHLTNFVMVGQASNYIEGKEGYWKDRTIELDFKLWTEVFKIPPERINFIEDVWVGPSAFGSCLESHVAGNEIGNSVFTEFEGTIDNFRQMPQRVVDVGLGLERIVWLTKATPTLYDAIFDYVLPKIIKKYSIEYDPEILRKYSLISGSLNLDEVADINAEWGRVAAQLGMSTSELDRAIGAIQKVYAICDHTKTILLAANDGGFPSNVGGGYNLRVVLRRALEFADELGIDILWVFEQHKKYLKKFIDFSDVEIEKIIEVERDKWKETKKNVASVLSKINKIDEDKMIELYDSYGIPPEEIKKYVPITVPHDFYARVTARHERESAEEKEEFNLSDLPETIPLWHTDEKILEFDAKVLRVIEGKYVILDKTAFYPESGGQEYDTGQMEGARVYAVRKQGNWVIHEVENPNFKVGQVVHCKIDPDRRTQLKIHHTSTHIINATARKVLGEHVWQGGTKKGVDKAHLDISHYSALTDSEIKAIENEANNIIKAAIPIKKEVLPRPVAEKKYTFRIYQGGPLPLEELRIVSIGDIDHEACGGTHLDNTSEAGRIIITKVEQPQDGIVRLVFVAGPAAQRYEEKCNKIVAELIKIFGVKNNFEAKVDELIAEWKVKRKELEEHRKRYAAQQRSELRAVEKGGIRYYFADCGDVSMQQVQEISKQVSGPRSFVFLYSSKEDRLFISSGVETNLNVGKIIREINEKFGTSGGGSQFLGQIALKGKRFDEILKHVKQTLGVSE